MSERLTINEFYAAASEGKLLGLKCDSGHVTVPPSRSCKICGSTSLKIFELSGKGTVISWTEVFVKSREFPISVPYLLALVELEEGGNLMGIFEDGTSKIRYQTAVKVTFRKLNEKELPRIFFSLV
jgi:uncharacterized protein